MKFDEIVELLNCNNLALVAPKYLENSVVVDEDVSLMKSPEKRNLIGTKKLGGSSFKYNQAKEFSFSKEKSDSGGDDDFKKKGKCKLQ